MAQRNLVSLEGTSQETMMRPPLTNPSTERTAARLAYTFNDFNFESIKCGFKNRFSDFLIKTAVIWAIKMFCHTHTHTCSDRYMYLHIYVFKK